MTPSPRLYRLPASDASFINVDIRQLLHRLVGFTFRLDHLFVVEEDPAVVILLDRGDIVTRMYRWSFVGDECLQAILGRQRRGSSNALLGRRAGHLDIILLPVIIRMTEQPIDGPLGIVILNVLWDS